MNWLKAIILVWGIAFLACRPVNAQDDLDFDALLDEIAESPEEQAAETPADATVEAEDEDDLDALIEEVDELTNGHDMPAPEADDAPAEEPMMDEEAPADAMDDLFDDLGMEEEPAVEEDPFSAMEQEVEAERALAEEDLEAEVMEPAEETVADEMADDAEAFDFDALFDETEDVGEPVEPAPAAVVDEGAIEEEPAEDMAFDETGMDDAMAEGDEPAAEAGEPTEAEALAGALGVEVSEAARILAQQEEVRLQALEVEALQALEEGYEAMGEERFAEAATKFELALQMPDRPKTRDSLQRARWGFAEANYRIARNIYKNDGDLNAALEKINTGLARLPDHAPSERLKGRLERALERAPTKLPVAKREEYKEKAKTIEELMDEGKQFYNVGDYNAALRIFEQVLLQDEYHIDAMRFLARIYEKRYDARSQELEKTREQMVEQVRDAWNPPIEGDTELPTLLQQQVSTDITTARERLEQKLESIVIPSLEFRQANITDVVNFLVEASIAGDPEEVGVNIILNLNLPGEGAAPSPVVNERPPQDDFFADDFGGGDDFFAGDNLGGGGDFGGGGGGSNVPTITLNLRRVTLLNAIRYITEVAGLKFRVERDAVIITPSGVVIGQVFTRMYPVQPSILDVIFEQEEVGDTGATGFFGGGDEGAEFGTRTTIKRGDVKDFFERAGVPFPVGTSIAYNAGISKLIVANTAENHDKLERVLAEINLTPSQVEIEARFVEINQRDLEELGFEWLLTDNYEIARDTGSGAPIAGQERVQIDANADEGGFTRGLRFFGLDTTAGNTDPFSGATAPSSVTPLGNILAFSTVLTNPEVQMVLRAIDQSGNGDVLSAPRVTTRTGQPALIQVVEEIIYPTEFEQDVQVVEGGEGVSDRQVVVVTPGAFETRGVGVILNVTPTVGPDGYTIDLALSPEVAELVDWIDYGSTFLGGQKIFLPQPVFASRNVTTTISIWDGQTVVMGGLMREKLVTIDDRIPVLGDIPLLGRLFRNEGQDSQKQNLIIFVTARLVRPDGRPLNEASGTGSEAVEGSAPVETVTP